MPKHSAASAASARPAPAPAPAPGSVELDLLEAATGAAPVRAGAVAARACASYSELWTAVSRTLAGAAGRASARLVYQDADGDWLLLLSEQPFAAFARSVTRLMVVKNKQVEGGGGGV
jgi:hypothetical protein